MNTIKSLFFIVAMVDLICAAYVKIERSSGSKGTSLKWARLEMWIKVICAVVLAQKSSPPVHQLCTKRGWLALIPGKCETSA
jgi:hypothetical protein